VSRQQASAKGSTTEGSAAAKENAEAQESALYSSNTALVNFCNSSFLRSKRKLNPEGSKTLTIDSDYKLKKHASNPDMTQAAASSSTAEPPA
jgi:primase-polymerase (primpol)-like protein